MKIGLFQMPLHPPERKLHETLEEDADKIVYADELGFHEAWVGEHFSATTEPISSPMMFMASLLRQTKNIVFGTGVVSLPNHHPAIVAAEAALFDHLSRGRFIFGIGPSGLASDHELFGNIDAVVRNERLMESIDTILKIWSQDPPYDIKGKHWRVKITDAIDPELGVGYLPKTYQRPHPPVAMSAMSPYSASVKTAVLRGWSPISANFCPEYIIASHWSRYLEGCRELGRDPTGQDWRVARNILVAESDQQALDWAMDPKGSNYYYFRYLWEVLKRANYTVVMKPEKDAPDETITTESLIASMVIHGSSRTVAEKLAQFRDRVGPFGTLLMASMDGSGENRHREWQTMRRLATEVLPELQASTPRQAVPA
jgi:alkanesulfonate monooxygenase SsuD/methylene tetrahydromethanopterin reductase-like flavin-dependent oxidoreductase (luciferase family)